VTKTSIPGFGAGTSAEIEDSATLSRLNAASAAVAAVVLRNSRRLGMGRIVQHTQAASRPDDNRCSMSYTGLYASFREEMTELQFDLQPTLQGKLIEVRPLKPEDFSELFEAARDPLIWEQHPESDRYKKEVFQKFFDTAIDSKGAFAVIERESGKIIGSSRYWNLNLAESEVEIGWTFLTREFWGGSYNAELKVLMLEHAFKFVERVLLIVGEYNLRSQKAVEKIGGSFLKKIDRPGRDGITRGNVVFVVTRSQFHKTAGAVHTQ
jgi:RimJ/RimL family protein N-acetyltransferase